MNEPIILLIDDVHLEHRDEAMQNSFAQSLQLKINNIIKEKNIPILVCAGDINENTNGLEWLKQFDCDIIYVCGNHEFWNTDYYEVIDNIKKQIQQPSMSKIHFLHNESIILHNIRFIGGTLWTNFLENWPWWKKNKIIEHFYMMADFKKITATRFYDSPQNINELQEFLSFHEAPTPKIQELIEKKLFNPLLQQLKEFNKTKDFISQELNKPFDGKTVVVTHHLPVEDQWISQMNMDKKVFSADHINDDLVFKNFVEKKPSGSKNILMMGFYANNLKNEFLFKKSSPDLWVHGHFHQPVINYFGKTLITSSPVGHMKDGVQQILSIKEIFMSNSNRMAIQFLQTSFKKINIEKKFKIIDDLKIIIKNAYIMINAGLATTNEFNTLIIQMNKEIQNEIDSLNKTIAQQLSSYIEHSQLADEGKYNQDYYTVNRMSGFYDWLMNNNNTDIPQTTPFEINEQSFGDDPTNNSHYIHWLKQLDKLYNDLIQYQKNLYNFSLSLQ